MRLPRLLNGKVEPLAHVPDEFPSSLADMPAVAFGPRTVGARLSYRPRETLQDGDGWASETIALRLRDDSWARLSLGDLGLPAELLRGQDPMGPGQLNDDGTRLALTASAGVVVLDLASGAFRHHASEAGYAGSIQWHPGGTVLTVDRRDGGPDVVVDVTSGEVSRARVPAPELGFRSTGAAVSIRRRGDADVVVEQRGSTAGEQIASLDASALMKGHQFTSFFSGDRVAYRNWDRVRGRQALRVADVGTSRPVATLTWGTRTATFLAVHGWWDRTRILLSMDRSLVTWAPTTGEIVRVATLPRSDIRGEHAAVGLNFPSPLS